jgi:hypothetical protein
MIRVVEPTSAPPEPGPEATAVVLGRMGKPGGGEMAGRNADGRFPLGTLVAAFLLVSGARALDPKRR